MSSRKPAGPSDDDRVPPPGGAGAKKPYQKPAFVHERVFETMALACGKTNPSSLQCKTNRKNS
jgi:hypothetical protein